MAVAKQFTQLTKITSGSTAASDIKMTDVLPMQHTDIAGGVNTLNQVSIAQSMCEPVAVVSGTHDVNGIYSASCVNYPDFSLTYKDKNNIDHYLVGMKVRVVFNAGITYGSTSSSPVAYPSLNISGSGALPMLAQRKTMASGAASAGQTIEFTLIPYGQGYAWDADSNVRESNSDYTVYTDGSIEYTAAYISANKLNYKKITLGIGTSYQFDAEGYYLTFSCYGTALGQDRTGGVAIGEGGTYAWYNGINTGLLPTVSGAYNSSSGKTTITIVNNTSFVQILTIYYVA